MGMTQKVVASTLVLTGGVTLYAVESNAETSAEDEEKIDQLESDILEKALRQYANPLNGVQAEIEESHINDTFIYEVKAGDTLSNISKKFDISVQEIVQENNIENEHLIHESQELEIRVKEKSYQVRFGETLKDIAKREGIEVAELMTSNPKIDDEKEHIYPGQVLNVPTVVPEIKPPAPRKQRAVVVASNNKSTLDVQADVSVQTDVSVQNDGTGFAWPLQGNMSSPFGTRWGRLHSGIDLTHSDQHAPIMAAKAGVVTQAYYHQGGYGRLVVMKHGDGLTTYYAHLSDIKVSKGQHISQGQVLGNMGRSGNASGNHLHFEIRVNNKPVNPNQYLP